MHVYANRGFLPRFLPDLNPLGTSFTRKRINFQFGEVVLKFFFELRQRSDLSSHIFNGQLRGFAKLMTEVDHQSSPGLLSRKSGRSSSTKKRTHISWSNVRMGMPETERPPIGWPAICAAVSQVWKGDWDELSTMRGNGALPAAWYLARHFSTMRLSELSDG